MSNVVSLPIASWDHSCSAADRQQALHALEHGSVLFFPKLAFTIEADEARLLSPAVVAKRKNISLDPVSGALRGSSADEAELKLLQRMMQRFATSNRALLANLLPHYTAGLRPGRTSFRPVEIAGRTSSWRKDDTRLHVDSFPSSPVRGERILRFFSNVNPHGQGRDWRLGEPFEDVARRFLPALPGPIPGVSPLFKMLGITKGRRSDYDHFMLRMHDSMKADLAYQASAAQIDFAFPAGSSWMVYTDQVSHAAMAGQHAFEQTYYLPIASMADETQAPLRILERLKGRALV